MTMNMAKWRHLGVIDGAYKRNYLYITWIIDNDAAGWRMCVSFPLTDVQKISGMSANKLKRFGEYDHVMGSLLLTWFNFSPIMDK